MRVAVLVLLLASAAHAQAVDLSASGGGVIALSGVEWVAGVMPTASVSATVTPALLGGRVRGTASVGFADGYGGSDLGQTLSAGLSVEAPLSGGRNGVYVALGGALVDVEGVDGRGCDLAPDCLWEGYRVSPYAGLAVTGGAGARVPVSPRVWIEPAASAVFWGEGLLPMARLGVGWRVR